MANQRSELLGLMALWLLAAATGRADAAPPNAAATPSQGANLSGVTVTAKPHPSVSVASEFVRHRLPESPVTGQYPRFVDPVCVRVQGLPSQFNTFIAQRVVTLAGEVSAPLSKSENCVPNIQVIFTSEPQRLLNSIARKREVLLGYHYQSQYQRLTTFSRPVQSWYVTRTRDTTGKGSFDIANTTGSNLDPMDAQFAGGMTIGGNGPHGRAGSRLGNDLSSDIAFSLILADASQVANGKIGPLADYIAVLALAQWHDIKDCNALVPSILNLMADACSEPPPEAVTSSDLSILKALYKVDPRETGSQQRMEIADKLSKTAVVEARGAH